MCAYWVGFQSPCHNKNCFSQLLILNFYGFNNVVTYLCIFVALYFLKQWESCSYNIHGAHNHKNNKISIKQMLLILNERLIKDDSTERKGQKDIVSCLCQSKILYRSNPDNFFSPFVILYLVTSDVGPNA